MSTSPTTTTSTTSTEPGIWPAIQYADAPAAVTFLVDVFGFEATLVVPNEDGGVAHAELRWPLGGGMMLGSIASDDAGDTEPLGGHSAVYVVTDEPDALFARVTAGGAEITRGLHDEDYGSRGFTARDPEGHTWSFGTYRGA